MCLKRSTITSRRDTPIVVPLIIVFVVLSTHAVSQKTAGPIQQLVSRAQTAFQDDQLDEAEELYLKALDLQEKNASALLGLGRIELERKNAAEARKHFERILAFDPQNIAAHYYLGIVFRELGIVRRFFNVLASAVSQTDWQKSADQFSWVVARDSLYEDVFLQYALLLVYQENYIDAIQMGRIQIRLRPTLVSAQLGLLKLYGIYAANERPMKALEWLRTQSTEFATYYTGEILRRYNRLDDAESVFRGLLALKLEMPLQPVCLSLAKIYYERQVPDTAEQFYWRALNESNSLQGIHFLFEDLKYILSDDEVKSYRRIGSLQKKGMFIRSFWLDRNPTPGATTNDRLTVHYRRLIYAEKHHAFYGVRIMFNNPDRSRELRLPKAYYFNQEFNDQGLIYLRHGAPNEVQTIGGEGVVANESWLYQATPSRPQMIFHFVMEKSLGGHWQLTDLPSNRRIWENLVEWDSRFFSLLNAKSYIEQQRYKDEIALERRSVVSEALSTEHHTWREEIKPFNLTAAIDAFRGESKRAMLDISYAVPLAVLAKEIRDSARVVKIRTNITVSRAGHPEVASETDTLSVLVSDRSSGAVVHLFRTTVPVDTYTVRLHLRPEGTNLVGEWRQKKVIPNFATNDLVLSDIQFLLPSPLKTKLEIQGIKVGPSPFRIYPRNKPIYVYFSMYGLVKDSFGKTAYDIVYSLSPETSPNKVAMKKQGFNIGVDETASELLTLDVGDLDTGSYLLTVAVTDRKSGRAASRSVPIKLYNP